MPSSNFKWVQIPLLCIGLLIFNPCAHAKESAFEGLSNELVSIYQQGQDELFIAGHSYHSRQRYSAIDIDRFNENNTGLGWVRTRYSKGVLKGESGDSAGIYLMEFSSSINQPQWNLGYLKEWYTPRWGNFLGGLQLAGGYTVLLLSRPDVLKGVPVPAALPVVSLHTPYVALELTYFPPANLAPAAQGDVWFGFVRVRW